MAKSRKISRPAQGDNLKPKPMPTKVAVSTYGMKAAAKEKPGAGGISVSPQVVPKVKRGTKPRQGGPQPTRVVSLNR